MKKVLKALGKTVKLIFAAFLLFLLSLCFRQQPLPESMVDWICRECSTERFVVSCDSMSAGFRHGFHFVGFRLYDRERQENLKPVFAADSVSVWLISRRITVSAAKLPRLHDGYYGIGTAEEDDGAADGFAFGDIELPDWLPEFTLTLIRPEILGIAPEKVIAEVCSDPKRLEFMEIRLEWPDQDYRMRLDGGCTLDFGRGRIFGEVHGTARQANIRPLLIALDLPASYPYMGGFPDTGTSGFTEVRGPLPVACGWNYDFAKRDFRLDLDLHPAMGRYNNVRLQQVDGKLGVHAHYPEDCLAYDIEVGPLVASDPANRQLKGWLTVHGTNDCVWLDFDAESTLEKQDTLDIIGYLNEGVFDDIKCATAPRITAKGRFECDDENFVRNDFGGTFEVERAEMLDQSVSDLRLDYRLRGNEILVTNLFGRGFTGGEITAWAKYHLPIADDDASGFYGCGAIETKNGRIVQVPLFLALTQALAENVPGVDKIVNQSESRCEFTVSNGVFHTDHLVVQGSLFCIKLYGDANIGTGELDFVAHCTVMKEESVLGKYLIQPVLWPFTKLLTEFRITGHKDNPVIRNTSVQSISDMTGGIINKVFN